MVVEYLGQRHVEVAALKASFTPIQNRLDGNSDLPAPKDNPPVRLHVPDAWLMRRSRSRMKQTMCSVPEASQADMDEQCTTSPVGQVTLQPNTNEQCQTSPECFQQMKKPEALDKVSINQISEAELTEQQKSNGRAEQHKSNVVEEKVDEDGVEALALEAIYMGGFGDAFEQLQANDRQNVLRQLRQALVVDIANRLQNHVQPMQPTTRPSEARVRTSPELPSMEPVSEHSSRTKSYQAQRVRTSPELPCMESYLENPCKPRSYQALPEYFVQQESLMPSNSNFTRQQPLQYPSAQSPDGPLQGAELMKYLEFCQKQQQKPSDVQACFPTNNHSRGGQVRTWPEFSPAQASISMDSLPDLTDMQQQEQTYRMMEQREFCTGKGFNPRTRQVSASSATSSQSTQAPSTQGQVGRAQTWPDLPLSAQAVFAQAKTWPDLPPAKAVASQESLPGLADIQEECAYPFIEERACLSDVQQWNSTQMTAQRVRTWTNPTELAFGLGAFSPHPKSRTNLPESRQYEQAHGTFPPDSLGMTSEAHPIGSSRDLFDEKLQSGHCSQLQSLLMTRSSDRQNGHGMNGAGFANHRAAEPRPVSAELYDESSLPQLLELCSKLTGQRPAISGDAYPNAPSFPMGLQPPPGLDGVAEPPVPPGLGAQLGLLSRYYL